MNYHLCLLEQCIDSALARAKHKPNYLSVLSSELHTILAAFGLERAAINTISMREQCCKLCCKIVIDGSHTQV